MTTYLWAEYSSFTHPTHKTLSLWIKGHATCSRIAGGILAYKPSLEEKKK